VHELERWKILQNTSDYRKSARANNKDTCVRDDSWGINNKTPIVRQKHPKPNNCQRITGIPPNAQREEGSSGASTVPCLCIAHGVCRSTEVGKRYEGRTIRWDAENRCETDAVCTYKKRATELGETRRTDHRGGNKDKETSGT